MLSSKLSIDDEDFLVASLVDRCPKGMMLRELVMNAIEAARGTETGRGSIWIGGSDVDGATKLTIRNSGPGMGAETLHRMCNIAASVGKAKGLNTNFGMGAKVASLPSNPLGVRYRSCFEGRVFEVVIGKYDGVYGRLIRKASDGRSVDIVEATLAYPLSERRTDWTEVVLLGETAEQDTLADPYAGEPVMPSYWIPIALYHRFYRIPGNVDIVLDESVHWSEGPRRFETIVDRIPDHFARAQTVRARNGIVIHYLYDPTHPERSWENASSAGALQSSGSIAALIYRDELYDVRTGSPWIFESPKYGITFAARHISVHIEFPDDYPVIPDTYRQFLRYAEGEQEHVELNHFTRLVNENRPDWLLELFDEFGRKAKVSENIESELKDLRQELGVLLYVHVERPDGEKVRDWVEPELEVVQLKDDRDIEDRWLKGRAASFYANTNQLFINTHYESIGLLADRLAGTFGNDSPYEFPPESLYEKARIVATEAIVRRIARALLHGLSKASQPELWHPGHIEKAIAPEALSIVADEWVDMFPATYDLFLERLQEGVA